MTTEQIKAQAIALSDQNWARLAEFLPAIERLAAREVITADELLIRAVLRVVAGDLHIRAVQAEELEDPPTPQEPDNG